MAKQTPPAASDAESEDRPNKARKKQGPTGKRSEREAQNLRPLVPEDRKAAKKQAQAQMRSRQQEAREGLARGDDRFLREADRGPQKRYMRNYIDARFTLGELLLPLMFVVIFTSFLPDNVIAVAAMAFIWIYLLVCVIEGIVLATIIKRNIARVVGESRVEKGFILGTLTRTLQLRFLRMPKSQVSRGEKIEFTGR